MNKKVIVILVAICIIGAITIPAFQKMTLQNQIQKVILKSRLKVAEHGDLIL